MLNYSTWYVIWSLSSLFQIWNSAQLLHLIRNKKLILLVSDVEQCWVTAVTALAMLYEAYPACFRYGIVLNFCTCYEIRSLSCLFHMWNSAQWQNFLRNIKTYPAVVSCDWLQYYFSSFLILKKITDLWYSVLSLLFLTFLAMINSYCSFRMDFHFDLLKTCSNYLTIISSLELTCSGDWCSST